MKRLPILLFAILAVLNSYGQQITLSGKVIDQETGEGLPYANVVLLKEFTGVITIETGEFRLSVPQTAKNDSVQFSFIGYGTKRLAVKDMIGQENIISLPKSAFMLAEVVVGLQMTAKDYVLAAYRSIPQNYYREDKAILATADYYGFTVENGKCIKYEEAVCSTHVPSRNDTLKPSTLILHAREDNNVSEMQLNQYWLQKKKKIEEEARDAIGELFTMMGSYVPAFNKDEVRAGEFSSEKEIQSTEFTLEGTIEYEGMQLVVVSDEGSGLGISAVTKCYIDKSSYAFVFIEREVIVPKYLFSILYTALKLKGNGIRISTRTQYRKTGDKWDIFSKNQNVSYQFSTKKRSSGVEFTANFVAESSLIVTSIEETDSGPFPLDVRYSLGKGSLAEQAQNQDPTFWDTYKPLRPKKFEEALNK